MDWKTFLKDNKAWIFLLLILLLGFYLRVYHLDYPVVGYHNWKETHYLTEARNFAEDGFFEHGFFVPEWDYPSLQADQSGLHSDTFPTTSIITGAVFMITGPNLAMARLISVLFALGSIVFAYLIIEKLFGREDLALLTALIMSINPLLVFFGRQVQLINPALFFSLAGVYFYLKWLDDLSWKNTVFWSSFLALGVITKYYFAIFLVPLLPLFPWEKLKNLKDNRELLKKYGVAAFIFLVFFSWTIYITQFGDNIASQVSRIDFGLVFSSEFWQILKSYLSDNFTLLGLGLAGLGVVLFFLTQKKEDNGFKFFASYLGISVVWWFVMADKLDGHNYHQYPLIPLITFFIAYGFLVLGTNISTLIKRPEAKWVVVGAIFLILLFPSLDAKNRMFDTQFHGLDVAGDYVREHKSEGDMAINSGHQAYGFLWHADVKGSRGIPNSLEDFQKYEEKNANWLFIYNWDFNKLRQPWFLDYIQENYEMKQIGIIPQGQNSQPIYFLLKKGDGFNMSNLNNITRGIPTQQKNYDLTGRNVSFYYLNLA